MIDLSDTLYERPKYGRRTISPLYALVMVSLSVILTCPIAAVSSTTKDFVGPIRLKQASSYRWCNSSARSLSPPPCRLLLKTDERPSCVEIVFKLPDGLGHSGHIYLGRVYTAISLKVGRKVIFSNLNRLSLSGPKALDIPVLILPLPDGSGGKELTMKIMSWYTLVGLEEPPIIGSYKKIVGTVLKREVPVFALGIIFSFIGLFSVIFYLFGLRDPLFASFGLFSIFVAAYSITGLNLPLLFTDYNAMLFNFLAFLFIPMPLIWFMSHFSPPLSKKATTVLLTFHSTLASLGLLILLVPTSASVFWTAFTRITSVVRSMYLVDGLVVLVLCAMGIREGKAWARIVFCGLLVMVAGVVHEVLRNSGVIQTSNLLYPYGMFAFTLSLFVVVVHRVMVEHRKVVTLTKEKGRLLRELHDGLGRHLTNIKMLSDIALYKKPSTDELYRNVGHISEISHSAIHELKGHMGALEAHTASWRGLIDFLTEEGRRLLRPHGIRFEIRVREERTPHTPPSALQWFHTTRIFHEAIENAIKHSDCQVVEVIIDIVPNAFKMNIRDNGTASEVRIAPGRGILNMESRARELGGYCRVDTRPKGEGVEVTFWFPLAEF